MPSPPDPDGVPVVNLNDWENNVWASSSSSSLTHNFTTSVGHAPLNPARSAHSLHRRRTSENAATTSHPKIPWMIQHSRVESSDSVRGHPLKRDSGGFSSSVFNDPTVTRPILNLRLSPGPTVDADKNPFEEEREVQTGPGEREELVLVHEVAATDSLPGVSLKYGISPADLRKANQMWPTDSIHLRKFLNVPVNQASKLKQLDVEAQGTGPGSSTTSLEATADIRRIPASHLSFFPQGSPSDGSSIDRMVTGGRRHRTAGQTTLDGGGLPALPPNPNPSSIFSTLPRAFPIAKDAIMSRLSLDSGGTPPKEEQEHEMGVVGRNRGINGEPLDPPRQGRDAGTNPESLRQGRTSGSRNYDAYRTREEECERASMAIRTSQLEPSPEMLVPVLGQKRAKGERETGF